MFTTISLLTPFAAWVNVSSMIYCTRKKERHRSTADVPWGLKQPDSGRGTGQTRLKTHLGDRERKKRLRKGSASPGEATVCLIQIKRVQKDSRHYRGDDDTSLTSSCVSKTRLKNGKGGRKHRSQVFFCLFLTVVFNGVAVKVTVKLAVPVLYLLFPHQLHAYQGKSSKMTPQNWKCCF